MYIRIYNIPRKKEMYMKHIKHSEKKMYRKMYIKILPVFQEDAKPIPQGQTP